MCWLLIKEPEGWISAACLQAIRRRSPKCLWTLSWKPRESNMVADLAANFF